ncbi:MAG TPA: hypothetical protein VIV65_11880 [Gemmatimonadaceae bacterium]|jgi:hypothetical protein
MRTPLIIATLLVAALAIAGTRLVASTKALQTAPAPAADVQALITYLAPLPTDSAAAVDSTVTIARDPFVEISSSAAPVPAQIGAASTSKRSSTQRWIVSSILLEGSRKSAIVNDVWVNLGDSLAGGSRLTAVERDHVIVTDANGVRHKVPIQGGET